MADDKKISELTVAGALTGTETLEVVQGGVNKKTTTQDIADLGGGGSVTSVSGTADRITSTGGATPVIDISATFEALLAKLASPALTGTPTVNGSGVSPGLVPAATTGVAVAFAVPQIYATPAAPETGNITLTATGLIVGTVQVLYHNNATAPTFGAEFVRLSGFYVTSTLNIIYMHAISASRIEYMIFQEL